MRQSALRALCNGGSQRNTALADTMQRQRELQQLDAADSGVCRSTKIYSSARGTARERVKDGACGLEGAWPTYLGTPHAEVDTAATSGA